MFKVSYYYNFMKKSIIYNLLDALQAAVVCLFMNSHALKICGRYSMRPSLINLKLVRTIRIISVSLVILERSDQNSALVNKPVV